MKSLNGQRHDRVQTESQKSKLFSPPSVSQDCVTGLSLCRKLVHDLFKMTKYEIMQRLLQPSCCGLGFDRRFFLKIMLALQKTGFIRTDQPKLWGCGDFKELTRFMQSLFFFPILSRREVKRGSARRVSFQNLQRKQQEKFQLNYKSTQRNNLPNTLQLSRHLTGLNKLEVDSD